MSGEPTREALPASKQFSHQQKKFQLGVNSIGDEEFDEKLMDLKEVCDEFDGEILATSSAYITYSFADKQKKLEKT